MKLYEIWMWAKRLIRRVDVLELRVVGDKRIYLTIKLNGRLYKILLS